MSVGGDGPHPISVTRRRGLQILTSGQVGIDPRTGDVPDDFEGQMRLAFANLRAALEDAGGGMETVLGVRMYLVRRADYGAMNQIYAQQFRAPPHPVRTTIVCDLVLPELLFEVEAVAEARSA